MAKKKASVKATAVKSKGSPKKAVKKIVKKAVKKATPKPVKKAVKKAKAAKVAKKPAKKAVKASAKKAAGKTAKTVVTKTAQKTSAKKPASVKTQKAPATSAVKQQPKSLQALVSPLDDRILVRLSEIERRTPGGLFIPDTVTQTLGNLEGQVVAVGRGHMNKKGHVKPMDVQVGDKVLFAEFAGSKIKIQNEDLIILRESEVMGVVSK